MDQNRTGNNEERPTSGSDFDGPMSGATTSGGMSGTNTGSSMGGTSSGTSSMSSAPGETEICEHCGAPLTSTSGVEQLLARLGLSDDMVNKLKSATANIDIDEYVGTAREYLKNSTDKAKTYTKENPGKVAAGVAVLALGAGLIVNAMRKGDE